VFAPARGIGRPGAARLGVLVLASGSAYEAYAAHPLRAVRRADLFILLFWLLALFLAVAAVLFFPRTPPLRAGARRSPP
jgi:hypothetical protein